LNKFTTDQLIRFSKATLMLFISLLGLLMLYSNFTDYATNYEALGHVLSMDTTSDSEKYNYRAITSPMLHHRIYWFVISLELVYTYFCLFGAYSLYRNINSNAEAFHDAKKPALVGLMIATFLYFVCFQVIGVEWFNMDRSTRWDYKEWAQDILDFIFPVLIYISMRIER